MVVHMLAGNDRSSCLGDTLLAFDAAVGELSSLLLEAGLDC